MTRSIVLSILIAFVAAVAQSQQPSPEDHMKDRAANCPFHAEHMKSAATAEVMPQQDSNSVHEQHMKQLASNDRHFSEMMSRGAIAMGFDQTKTTHHFRSLPDGGAIEVTVNDPADTPDLLAIQHHLRVIASQFAAGDFSAAVSTHNETPTGADVMIKRRRKLLYNYEVLPNGAMVRIVSKDKKSLSAVHDFLAYQIREHRTGDPLPPTQ
jgi:hypothetical protein